MVFIVGFDGEILNGISIPPGNLLAVDSTIDVSLNFCGVSVNLRIFECMFRRSSSLKVFEGNGGDGIGLGVRVPFKLPRITSSVL